MQEWSNLEEMKYCSHTEFAVLKAELLEKSREIGLRLDLVMDMTTRNVTFGPRIVRSLAVILGLGEVSQWNLQQEENTVRSARIL